MKADRPHVTRDDWQAKLDRDLAQARAAVARTEAEQRARQMSRARSRAGGRR